jgi:hypothetical protein
MNPNNNDYDPRTEPKAISKQQAKDIAYLLFIYLIALVICIETRSFLYILLAIAFCAAATYFEYQRFKKSENCEVIFTGACVSANFKLSGEYALRHTIRVAREYKYIFTVEGKTLVLYTPGTVPFKKGRIYRPYLPSPSKNDEDITVVHGLYGYDRIKEV